MASHISPHALLHRYVRLLCIFYLRALDIGVDMYIRHSSTALKSLFKIRCCTVFRSWRFIQGQTEGKKLRQKTKQDRLSENAHCSSKMWCKKKLWSVLRPIWSVLHRYKSWDEEETRTNRVTADDHGLIIMRFEEQAGSLLCKYASSSTFWLSNPHLIYSSHMFPHLICMLH